jgi:hypothetical protein
MDLREPKTDETGRPPLRTLSVGRPVGLGEGRVFAEEGEGSSSWTSSGEDSRLVMRVGPRRFLRVLDESLFSLSGSSRVVGWIWVKEGMLKILRLRPACSRLVERGMTDGAVGEYKEEGVVERSGVRGTTGAWLA